MWRKVVIVLGSLVAVCVATALALTGTHSSDSSSSSSENTLSEKDLSAVVVSDAIISISTIDEDLTEERENVSKAGVTKASRPYQKIQRRGTKEFRLISKYHLPWVSRSEWVAEPPTESMGDLQHPVPCVIIAHTATEDCLTRPQCILRTRVIQEFHIESRNWSDIGYNFLVGGDGEVYDGRGWDVVGAHTKGYNKYSIGIAFIGSFNTETPTNGQLEACQKLIKIGVDLGKLAKDYEILAPCNLYATISPGEHLLDIIQKWPHFVKKPTHGPA